MKENRFQRTLADGKVAVGHMIMEFNTRGVARILDVAGVDFVLIDTEHAGFSTGDVADLLAWFQATTVAPIVRVPQIEYHLIARILDAGALGVMVPNVKNAEQARAIVDAVKYAPQGSRGVGLGGALTGFRTVEPAEFMADSNRNTTIICQIESEEGLANLDAIAGTAGVDVLWVGHFDLSQSMGIPGQFQEPRFLEGLRRVISAAREHGLAAGIQPGSVEQAQGWMEIGFNVISYASDHAVYRTALTHSVERIRGIAEDTR